MATLTSCITGTLQPYIPSSENPWNETRVKHAYRRLGYDASKSEIATALGQSPSEFIDQLIDASANATAWPTPAWSDFTYEDYENLGLDFDEQTQANHMEVRNAFMDYMINYGLRGKLMLFWSNHFVTRLEDYYSSNHLYEYFSILETYAFGNFKDFVDAIGKTSAMLIYLNGFENTNNSPNENYARELYELFTLGVDNGYTQQDIVETSKALTGFNHRTHWTAPITFDASTFDNSSKLIFTQEGNFGYDDVIRILFEEKTPLIANYICKKLYQYFVSATINETVVSEMANIFQQDLDLKNVLSILFKSEHFFEAKTIGISIKSPYDLFVSYLKVTNFSITPDYLEAFHWFTSTLGQTIFNPIDVAGWQGDKDWINSSTLTGRWQVLGWVIWHTWDNFREELRAFAVESSTNSNDPYVVAKSVVDRFVPLPLYTEADYQIATDIFKHNVPQNYYDDGLWNLQWDTVPFQMVQLLRHLITIPEFQLK